jgi:homoserine kinase
MGFAVRGIGDRVTIRLTENGEGSKIINRGNFGNLLPVEMERNTAGVAVNAFLEAIGRGGTGIHIELEKNLPLGSGMGSSAASAAAALVGANELFGNMLSPGELIRFAMESEKTASGSAHADNAAPSLLGGFVIIRSHNPPDIVRIKCPDDLCCIVTHPHIEVNTSDARRILKKDIPMNDVTRQTANTAAFVTGLLTGDFDLIGRSMNDLLAEPKRIKLIPGFGNVRIAAVEAGALGCGISGSGPSVFALFRGEENGEKISRAIRDSFLDAGLDSESFITSLNEPGACIIKDI